MRRIIHLRFTAEVAEEAEAWLIADALEAAAIKKDFTGISSWVEDPSGGRAVLVPEGEEPVSSEAQTLTRMPGNLPTGAGDSEGVLMPIMPGTEVD